MHARPLQLASDAVDQPYDGPVDLIVVVILVIDGHQWGGLPGGVQMLQRSAGGVAGVIPALERGNHYRVAQHG
ncbi:Uncharacterised protein [Mycobacteroides abscessus subsp. abscessus]|nr:Uncharacterised protein [Mycobacteroides abscessus]SHT38017.1 Uncharacterised protein [Mycobacteroides abscessus subsp. abscessus]SHU31598.1 Uncharacterised protein [Mycobacteroides abscessus subsp. abscessus]SKU74867.1 Uncharacterised protein [Mycobacteroides abscessus subsp. abscessus]